MAGVSRRRSAYADGMIRRARRSRDGTAIDRSDRHHRRAPAHHGIVLEGPHPGIHHRERADTVGMRRAQASAMGPPKSCTTSDTGPRPGDVVHERGEACRVCLGPIVGAGGAVRQTEAEVVGDDHAMLRADRDDVPPLETPGRRAVHEHDGRSLALVQVVQRAVGRGTTTRPAQVHWIDPASADRWHAEMVKDLD